MDRTLIVAQPSVKCDVEGFQMDVSTGEWRDSMRVSLSTHKSRSTRMYYMR